MNIEVLCKIISHAPSYGKTGDVIEVPDAIGEALILAKRAKKTEKPVGKAKESANSK
jgi:hypothetical protein